MKCLIVYQSLTGNTAKIVEGMAVSLGAEVIRINNPNQTADLSSFDLIGFGSGIYMGKHHKQILKIAEGVNPKQKVFVFSTAGSPSLKFIWHRSLRTALLKKKAIIIGDYCINGLDLVGPLKKFGGINKGRPNKKDIDSAKNFAEGLKRFV